MKAINLPDNFCVFRSDADPKENIRVVYDLACEHDEFSEHEPSLQMFIRTGLFIIKYIDQLNSEYTKILENTGLIGGAAGNAPISAIEHLDTEDALNLFEINYALLNAERIRDELNKMLIAWNSKKMGDET